MVIIGFKAAGKTTLSRVLAQILSFPCYDLDDLVLQKSGYLDIKTCFASLGEKKFRNLELEVVKELALFHQTRIISTGGGVILNNDLMKHLKTIGKILFLNTNYKHIENRLFQGKDEIHYLNQKLTPASLKAIYEKRLPQYIAYSDLIIGED